MRSFFSVSLVVLCWEWKGRRGGSLKCLLIIDRGKTDFQLFPFPEKVHVDTIKISGEYLSAKECLISYLDTIFWKMLLGKSFVRAH